MAKTQNIQTVGRRKTASARVRLISGEGEDQVNGVPANQYFSGLILESIYSKPWKSVEEKLHMTAIVSGGGIYAQAQAVAHGLARAISQKTPDLKKALRAINLMTRDPRMKERRKAGNAQAARAKKSSPKR